MDMLSAFCLILRLANNLNLGLWPYVVGVVGKRHYLFSFRLVGPRPEEEECKKKSKNVKNRVLTAFLIIFDSCSLSIPATVPWDSYPRSAASVERAR